MALTLIRNRIWTPERIARHPRKVRGGWVFTHPEIDLRRYNRHARNQAITEWAGYGAMALAAVAGGSFGGLPPMMGTLVADGGSVWPLYMTNAAGAPGTTATTLDAAGEYYANVYRCVKAGSLDRFGFLSGTSSGAPTADFELQSVGADGLLSGTVLGATNNAKATGVSVSSTTWTEPAWGEVAVVTKGQLVAAVVRYASGTSLQTRQSNTNMSPSRGYGYSITNVSGSPVKSAAPKYQFALRYNDGTYMFDPYSYPISSTTLSETMASGTTNHRGNVWTAPGPKRAIGGWIVIPSTTLDYSVVVAADAWDGTADNDGTSNIALAIENEQTMNTASLPVFWLSDASLSFSAGGDYRSLIKATDASNITIYEGNYSSAAILDSMEGGQAFRWTQAHNPTGAGDWTDTATKRAFTGFWFDQSDDGAGSGGGGGPLVGGRLVR